MKTYTFADVMRIVGVSRSHLTHWTKLGVVSAPTTQGKGPGHHRQFSFFNLIEAHIAQQLNSVNVSAGVMRMTLAYLRLLESSQKHSEEDVRAVISQLVRRAAQRVAKGAAVKRVRIAEVSEEQVEDHLSDYRIWQDLRRPGTSRESLFYAGLLYMHEHGRAGGFPRLFAVPRNAMVSPENWRGYSAFIMVSLLGISDLELEADDSLV